MSVEGMPMPRLVDAISAVLSRQGAADCTVDAFESLPSTNRWLGARLRGMSADRTDTAGTPDAHDDAPTLPWMVAVDRQTDGIGRRGKTWMTAPGNITFSIASRLASAPSDLTALGLVVGIGVVRVLRRHGVAAGLKWPNDVLVAGRKLGGILIEVMPERDGRHSRVVVGIGLNYRQEHFGHAGGLEATDLAREAVVLPDRGTLIGTLAARVLADEQRYVREGWAAFENAWRDVDVLRGREVEVLRDDRREAARTTGVDARGALQVEFADGRRETLYAGEISIRPV